MPEFGLTRPEFIDGFDLELVGRELTPGRNRLFGLIRESVAVPDGRTRDLDGRV